MPINAFPGYEYIPFGEDNKPHNMYKGEDVGFGGYVWAKPGMYGRVVCFDVSGMHPASIRALNYFGDYTHNFADIVDARLAIKHKDFDKARSMLDGKLIPYLKDESQAKELAKALKIAVNSAYGLTAAKFENPMRDSRNVNNIVALRGALFISDLKREVQSRGYTVIHCKTDSIKVVEPDELISKFIMDYGKKYDYMFEIEHIFDRICLVNDAVYIAKLSKDDPDAPDQWTATGKQFQIPYVFKKLFSKEKIIFEDMCETKSVQTAIYLDMNEGMPEDEHNYKFVGKVGQFCPMIEGAGGGYLMREKEPGKYMSVTGTKKPDGSLCRWMESQMVLNLNKQREIDKSYYNRLCDEAVDTISQYGDFERFVEGE